MEGRVEGAIKRGRPVYLALVGVDYGETIVRASGFFYSCFPEEWKDAEICERMFKSAGKDIYGINECKCGCHIAIWNSWEGSEKSGDGIRRALMVYPNPDIKDRQNNFNFSEN